MIRHGRRTGQSILSSIRAPPACERSLTLNAGLIDPGIQDEMFFRIDQSLHGLIRARGISGEE
ncbi:hypothetical protein ASZ90_014644 [hydrocarbon metagenome]|uniref:Uncharacterized protein n=1 Tax=hydrocarbon metagenome TaxID=938273 RepID=A0A0W8F494_9ZZZZ